MVKFLLNSEEVLAAVQDLITSHRDSDVYVSGPTAKPLLDAIMGSLGDGGNGGHLYLIVPGLTGKDYLGHSFLYQITLLANRIRINNKAVHHLIVNEHSFIMVSVYSKRAGDFWMSGVWIWDSEEVKRANEYCKELWDNSLPLHFTAK